MPNRYDPFNSQQPRPKPKSKPKKKVRFAPLPPPHRPYHSDSISSHAPTPSSPLPPRPSSPSGRAYPQPPSPSSLQQRSPISRLSAHPPPPPPPLVSSRSSSSSSRTRLHVVRMRGREALNDLRFYLSSACNLQGDTNFWLALSVFPVNALCALISFVNALRNDIDTKAIARPEKLLHKLLKADTSKRHPHEFLEEIDPSDPNVQFDNQFERSVRISHRKRMRREAEHCLLWFVSQQLRLPVRVVRELPLRTREQRELDAFKDRIRKFNAPQFPNSPKSRKADSNNNNRNNLRRSRSARVPSTTISNYDDSIDTSVISDDVGGTSSAPQSPAGRRQTGYGYGIYATERKSPRSAPMGGQREPIEIAHLIDGLADIALPQTSFDVGVATERQRHPQQQQHPVTRPPANPHPSSIVIESHPLQQSQPPLQQQQQHVHQQPPTQHSPYGGIGMMHDPSIYAGTTMPEGSHSSYLHPVAAPAAPLHPQYHPQFFTSHQPPPPTSTPAPYDLPPSPTPLHFHGGGTSSAGTSSAAPATHYAANSGHATTEKMSTSPYSQPLNTPIHQTQAAPPPAQQSTSPYTGPTKYGTAAPPPPRRSYSPGGPAYSQPYVTQNPVHQPPPTTPSPKFDPNSNPNIQSANVNAPNNGGYRYSRTPPSVNALPGTSLPRTPPPQVVGQPQLQATASKGRQSPSQKR